MTDTVYAPATAPGRAAVAVVRLSGPDSGGALRALAGGLPAPRRASLRILRDADGAPLDQALVLWMPAPGSFTGEDAVELHLHGGAAVAEGVVTALAALGLRLAEPGEFTRRAFENGRLDLVEAEAVADLVDAESAAQRRQALDQLGGAMSARHAAWRETLLDALAHLEAAMDFPDEDLPDAVAGRARPPLLLLRSELEAAAADRRGERVREGLRVALIGAPNAGKSSLLNALLGRDAAIVTATPGTTRDVLEHPLRLAGASVLLADTAGLRDTDEAIEAEGVRRARAWAAGADLRLHVVDASGEEPPSPAELCGGDWRVLNKRDLPPGPASRAQVDGVSLLVSAHDKADVQDLRSRLDAWAAERLGGAEPPAATRLRHRQALADAAASLSRATSADPAEPELMAEDVRLAVRALERLSGRIGAEEVLGRVFSSFCIGK